MCLSQKVHDIFSEFASFEENCANWVVGCDNVEAPELHHTVSARLHFKDTIKNLVEALEYEFEQLLIARKPAPCKGHAPQNIE